MPGKELQSARNYFVHLWFQVLVTDLTADQIQNNLLRKYIMHHIEKCTGASFSAVNKNPNTELKCSGVDYSSYYSNNNNSKCFCDESH